MNVSKRWSSVGYALSFDPLPISAQDIEAVDKIVDAVGLKQRLSLEQKAGLWRAIQVSKGSRRRFETLKRYRGSPADMQLLRTVQVRCGEIKRLLSQYTADKALAHPDGKKVDLALYLGVLDEIRAVAKRTVTRETTQAGFSPSVSLGELYVGGILADVYETVFRLKATPTMPANGAGPFIRFVLAVHTALGLPPPSPASVRTWRRRYQQKHVQT